MGEYGRGIVAKLLRDLRPFRADGIKCLFKGFGQIRNRFDIEFIVDINGATICAILRRLRR